MVLRRQSDSASTVSVHGWVVHMFELEFEDCRSRAPRSLFVVRWPMTLHIEVRIIGERRRPKIQCLNRALKISVLRQWEYGTKILDQTKQDMLLQTQNQSCKLIDADLFECRSKPNASSYGEFILR